jgi:hypothetical protein
MNETPTIRATMSFMAEDYIEGAKMSEDFSPAFFWIEGGDINNLSSKALLQVIAALTCHKDSKIQKDENYDLGKRITENYNKFADFLINNKRN